MALLSMQAVARVQAQAQSSSTGAGLAQRASAFVTTLAQAMARQDRAAVADLIRYPTAATVGSVNIPLTNRAGFLKVYDGIFTAELRCLVETSAAAGASGIRVEGRGVSFAEGRVQAQDVDGTLKITRINVPPAGGAAAPPPSKPRRVTLRSMGKTQFSGRLYGDGVDAYIVSLKKGDVVEARIEKFPGRSAALRVVEQKTGKVLDRPAPKASDGTAAAPRVWTDTIREDGDYRVEVVRLASYCAPSITYLLTITLK
jgi:hypothetical protein